MGDYSRHITRLRLFKEIERSPERDDVDPEEARELAALVTHVAETAGPLLARIPETFHQYTGHDIHHCRNLIDRMGRFIPPRTLKRLNALELALLHLAALLHDSGMVVGDEEKAQALASADFRQFRLGHPDRERAIEDARAAGEEFRARLIEDALLAEYYRRLHPERVSAFLGRHLTGRLTFREHDLAEDLARLCESHAWGVEESNDSRHPEKAVRNLPDNRRFDSVRVNLQYLACCLRLADILDFDRSRTPVAVFQHLTLTEERSWVEWNKHLQVNGWDIAPTKVAFEIRCTHPAFYVAVHEFLTWIDDELRSCRHLVDEKPAETAERYCLELPPAVDRRQVTMKDPSYVAGAFRFQLEFDDIMRLLMDKSLYPDPSLFLRELLQNALDACRRKEAQEKLAGRKGYKGQITVWDYQDDAEDPRIVFQDNGVGMSLRIVEQYFLRIGKSYYRSPEFTAERQAAAKAGIDLEACSQFGIGILSCFLVGDRFEIETYHEGSDLLQVLIEGPQKYFVVRQLSHREPESQLKRLPESLKHGPINYSGTRITVYLRPRCRVDVLKALRRMAVNADYSVRIDGKVTRTVTIKAWGWEASGRRNLHKQALPSRATTPTGNNSVQLPADLIIPCSIPFEEHSQVDSIYGHAWFWLLRSGSGAPSPAHGYLCIRGKRLTLRGLPRFLFEFDGIPYADARQRRGVIELLEETADKPAPEAKNRIDEYCRARYFVSGFESGLFQCYEYWRVLDEAEQRAALANLRAQRQGAQSPWWLDEELLREFFAGSVEWANRGVGLGDEPSLLWECSPKELALHGVLVPEGVVGRDPLGNMARVDFLDVAGGYCIDIRGSVAPTPLANRLAIDAAEANDLIAAFCRGVLLYGAELMTSEPCDPYWRAWYEALFLSLPQGGVDVVPADVRTRIADVVGLSLLLPGGRHRLVALSEVLCMLGRRAAVLPQTRVGGGFIERDRLNQWLLAQPDPFAGIALPK